MTMPYHEPSPDTGRRKAEHLRVALEEDVRGAIPTGLDEYRFTHQALPELDMDAIDLSTTFLGKRLRAPILISCMTGGTEEARRINANLATAAQEAGVALGLGSLRVALENPQTAASFQVRALAPDVVLLANLGAVQLNYGYGVDECRRAMELTGADALALHLNPIQEGLQESGNTNFAGLKAKIAEVARQVPVVLKEVGFGLSEETARWAAANGIVALDTAGAGGTDWSLVEGKLRAGGRRVAAAFSGWGIPTAESIRAVRRGAPGLPVVASGGLRTGVDIAKAIALGADLGGIALPFLRAAALSPDAVLALLRDLQEELRLACFGVGAANLAALARTPLVRRGRPSGEDAGV